LWAIWVLSSLIEHDKISENHEDGIDRSRRSDTMVPTGSCLVPE